MKWSVVADRLALPLALLAGGIVLILAGERDIGIALLALGVGVPLPQKASTLLRK